MLSTPEPIGDVWLADFENTEGNTLALFALPATDPAHLSHRDNPAQPRREPR